MDPSLQELIASPTIKWIFVGGKGGVGKTSTSCAVAALFAKARPASKVLIISTDPAHNLSDAFRQKFDSTPVAVAGFTNLEAMEVTPSLERALGGDTSVLGEMGSDPLFQELQGAIPGVDEAMAFAEVLRLVVSMAADIVIFDTAPTGHTLRLLGLPAIMDKAMGKLLGMQAQFGGMFSQVASAFGGVDAETMGTKMQALREVVQNCSAQFQNPELTTFVTVCIAEFLSVYESERLIQELAGNKMDTRFLVVNQIVLPEPGRVCRQCSSRIAMQSKYLGQIDELYEDFHVVRVPLLFREIRGAEDICRFGTLLTHPMLAWDEERVAYWERE
eukprot:c45408_g1_i1.p1 GENE.c45408_g1_i1~~c45408_g1_i1.p1  ORF type:complete len:346 (+),score=68.79 c45408_g1_i1:48-1040(+)